MSYDYKVLGEGQLAATKGTLYTVPAGKTAAIKVIRGNNTGAGANVVQIFLKPGSTSRRIYYESLAANANLLIADVGMLEAGDLIEGQATNANEVDYVIMGAET